MTIRVSFLVSFAAATMCLGQSERGNITGVAMDASNSVVPNAPVKVVNQGTNAAAKVTASSSGEYSVPNLVPGTYRLEVSVSGFQNAIVDGIALTAGATVRVDVRLQVGGVTQTVEVAAHNTQIQTEDAKISTAVSNQLVDELPLVVGGFLARCRAASSSIGKGAMRTNTVAGGMR
jgi:Carboxypeptidase regulatory-like domain